MAVYQPSAIVGNNRTLVGVGEHGELMSFYYPHIDFPQNLNQGMPALYIGKPGKGELQWTFQDTWKIEQNYLARTNVLRTTCHHLRLGIELAFTDFVLSDFDVLVREVEIRNPTATPFIGTFYQYLDLQLGEVQIRNGVRWISERELFAQYWRDLAFAIGGDRFDQFGCGKAGEDSSNSAKLGMQYGQLSRNAQEIGDVDLAVGWEVRLGTDETARRLLLISAATSERDAVTNLEIVHSRGYMKLLRQTENDAHTYLAQVHRVNVPAPLEECYWRSLLALRLLYDEEYGAFLAAPEFDPTYERSGGYGYCWPRDAAEVILALGAVGMWDMGQRFLDWASQVQNPDGSWEQRYWLNGERGPAWCTVEGFAQNDQAGSMLMAIEKLITALPSAQQSKLLPKLWPTVQKGAQHLMGEIDPAQDLQRPGCDLWETFHGSFSYTNAAIRAGLRAAAGLAYMTGNAEIGAAWEAQADRIKATVLQKLWLGSYFARGISADGEVDPVVDSSILGLIEPFCLLDLRDTCEREMAEASVETIARVLAADINGQPAIRRFEGDQYLGGSAGGVNTLWMARALLRLAQESDGERARGYQQRAIDYIHTVLSRATAAGLLPELIGGAGAPSHWAAPHGWAMSAYIENMLLLDQLEGSE
jgi:oligosaccharide amylase